MYNEKENIKPKEKPTPKLSQITQLSAEHRRELLMGFARMTDEEKLDVLDLQKFLMRQHLNEWKFSPAIALGALVEALAKRQESIYVLSKKESKGDGERLLKMRIQSLLREKGEGKKEKQYRTRFHSLVCDLRSGGLGWRKCCDYLKKYHRFEISYSRLRVLFEKYQKFGRLRLGK